MKKNVLFSIVMPTRNRGVLLQNALQTALGQTFDDYEVIVCDNNSSDKTREIVGRFKHPRLSYFRSEKTLSMPDNWEYAWSHANGKYVLYLCDDDAYLPNTLSFLAETVIARGLPVMSWDLASYTYLNWIDQANCNILSAPAQSSGVRIQSTEELRKDLCHFRTDKMWWPRLNNSCVERSVLNQWHSKLGRLFFPLCPDYSLMNICFHVFSEIAIIERPLSIAGVTPSGIGASQVSLGTNESASNFLKEFGNMELFKECKSTLRIIPNMVAMTMLNSNQALKAAGVQTTEVDWEACMVNMAHALREIGVRSRSFFDLNREILLGDAEKLSVSCRSRVEDVLLERDRIRPMSWAEKVRAVIGRVIQSSEVLIRLETWLRYGGDPIRSFRRFRLDRATTFYGGRIRVDGNQLGVKSILDVAGLLNQYLEKSHKFLGKSK